jgi:hypothetical protein
MNSSIVARVGFPFLALSFILSAGCGGPRRATVSGKVTLDSQPLEKGMIVFSVEGSNTMPVAASVVNGEYEAKDVVMGTNKVVVRLDDAVQEPGEGGRSERKGRAREMKTDKAAAQKSGRRPSIQTFAGNNQAHEINEDRATLNIDLRSSGR